MIFLTPHAEKEHGDRKHKPKKGIDCIEDHSHRGLPVGRSYENRPSGSEEEKKNRGGEGKQKGKGEW